MLRMIVFDIDGVLTDGMVQVDAAEDQGCGHLRQ